jgi:hypothetical protein
MINTRSRVSRFLLTFGIFANIVLLLFIPKASVGLASQWGYGGGYGTYIAYDFPVCVLTLKFDTFERFLRSSAVPVSMKSTSCTSFCAQISKCL